jgi:hypothetical protein
MTTPDAATAASCAHLQVGWKTHEENGLTTGWWECLSGCHMRFIPSALHAQAVAAVEAEVARLRQELRSIAANTCCDRCQEAALVAQLALDRSEGFALRARGPQG